MRPTNCGASLIFRKQPDSLIAKAGVTGQIKVKLTVSTTQTICYLVLGPKHILTSSEEMTTAELGFGFLVAGDNILGIELWKSLDSWAARFVYTQ